MSLNVSTRADGLAKAPARRVFGHVFAQPRVPTSRMSRFVLIVLAVLAVGIAAGFLVLGAFPPTPAHHTVSKVLPNESFGQPQAQPPPQPAPQPQSAAQPQH